MSFCLLVTPRELAIIQSCVEQCARIQETADRPNPAFIAELDKLTDKLSMKSVQVHGVKGVQVDA